VTEVRALIRTLGLRKPHLYFTDVPFLTANSVLIQRLTGLAGVQEVSDGVGLHLASTSYNCWLDVDAGIAQAHLVQIATQISEQAKRAEGLKARLSNENYVKNAPKEVVEETKAQLAECEAMTERLSAEQRRFEELQQ
jgi:valyl-tRNA synthetase